MTSNTNSRMPGQEDNEFDYVGAGDRDDVDIGLADNIFGEEE